MNCLKSMILISPPTLLNSLITPFEAAWTSIEIDPFNLTNAYKLIEALLPKFNKTEIVNKENISLKISKGLDIFERGHNLKKLEIDSTFPKYILQNKDKLKKWII